ncbi:MAG: hypothetical protein AAB573_05050 [Patescibacteria group bacterium]
MTRGEAISADVETLVGRGFDTKAIAKKLGINKSIVYYRTNQLGVTADERRTAKRKAELRKEVVEKLKINRGVLSPAATISDATEHQKALSQQHASRLSSFFSHLKYVQNVKPKSAARHNPYGS